MYTVREGICLTLTESEGFEGVLELLFFTDSDHVGNTDGTSNSGMAAFLNNNYFHGYSCGQKCLTLNTAESEYIAMVKCLQFAIWTMILFRELQFRVMYPIPILADNVAAILIAKSPGHTKYARHIALRTHYIRSVLTFRDFILAYIKTNWNFADLNTKAVTPDIFRRLSLRVLCGLHTFNWRKEISKTLEEIWQQTKARDDAREMEEHVDRFNDTRRTQRAEETAKERELLRLEQQPTKQTTNVVGFTSAKGRTSSGGVLRVNLQHRFELSSDTHAVDKSWIHVEVPAIVDGASLWAEPKSTSPTRRSTTPVQYLTMVCVLASQLFVDVDIHHCSWWVKIFEVGSDTKSCLQRRQI
jgi:hypothetical protein